VLVVGLGLETRDVFREVDGHDFLPVYSRDVGSYWSTTSSATNLYQISKFWCAALD
jgi:hypothetical protein